MNLLFVLVFVFAYEGFQSFRARLGVFLLLSVFSASVFKRITSQVFLQKTLQVIFQ